MADPRLLRPAQRYVSSLVLKHYSKRNKRLKGSLPSSGREVIVLREPCRTIASQFSKFHQGSENTQLSFFLSTIDWSVVSFH